ncbi:MAG: hypothetical protein WCJ21_01130 [Planctomycetota bacterium]
MGSVEATAGLSTIRLFLLIVPIGSVSGTYRACAGVFPVGLWPAALMAMAALVARSLAGSPGMLNVKRGVDR